MCRIRSRTTEELLARQLAAASGSIAIRALRHLGAAAAGPHPSAAWLSESSKALKISYKKDQNITNIYV